MRISHQAVWLYRHAIVRHDDDVPGFFSSTGSKSIRGSGSSAQPVRVPIVSLLQARMVLERCIIMGLHSDVNE